MEGPSLILLDSFYVEAPDEIVSQVEAQEYVDDSDFFEDEYDEEWDEQPQVTPAA